MAVLLGCAMQASLNHGSTLKEYDTDSEVFRQQFRQFPYQQAAGPREAFNKLRELCRQWLQPAMRSKEEILELLVLEQLLTILPPEIETWVRFHHSENTGKLLTLIEDLQRELRTPEQQVGGQQMLLEELTLEGTAHIPPNSQQEFHELHVLAPSQEAPVAEAWIPQAGPQYLSYGAAGEWLPFSGPGSVTDTENEEIISERENLENNYPYIFTSEDSALPTPFLHTGYKELENKMENVPYLSKPVDDQNPLVAEKTKCSNLKERVTTRTYKKRRAAEKSYQCPQCGTCFPWKSLLTKHQKLHLGSKPYKCPECKEIFVCRSDFDRHQQLHTEDRPFECTICQKRFRKRAHVTVHQRIHFKGETYTCLECKQTFPHPFSFKRHLKRHNI